MKTVQFPPICPFGGDEDAARFYRNDSHFLVWSLTEANGRFLLVFTHPDGDASYLIDDLAGMRTRLDEVCEGLEDCIEFVDTSAEVLTAWGFGDLVRRCGEGVI